MSEQQVLSQVSVDNIRKHVRHIVDSMPSPKSHAIKQAAFICLKGAWSGGRRRRSTVEMISHTMCLTVLSHVLKDSMLHLIRSDCHSRSRGQSIYSRPLSWLCASYTQHNTGGTRGLRRPSIRRAPHLGRHGASLDTRSLPSVRGGRHLLACGSATAQGRPRQLRPPARA
jgi:hypothetical protein